jgi:hypothetical protein
MDLGSSSTNAVDCAVHYGILRAVRAITHPCPVHTHKQIRRVATTPPPTSFLISWFWSWEFGEF